MFIQSLHIQRFRNLTNLQIVASPNFNCCFGMNGSGKTSFLEALYYLSYGRSFRTNTAQHLIQYNQNGFALVASIQTNDQFVPLGMERLQSGHIQARLNGEKVHCISQLASWLPIQFIGAHSESILTSGPKLRRQYIDWGLFHVKHKFHDQWKEWQNLLKQRNAALKQQRPEGEIRIWDQAFCQLSEQIDCWRQEYVDQLQPIMQSIFQQFLPEHEIGVTYDRGWPENDLGHHLRQEFARDRQLGYTYFGPQRADLQFTINSIDVADVLSQGQQKLVAYALYLAQGILLQQETIKTPIYLIDDLPSELDQYKRQLVMKKLIGLSAQVFVTAIHRHDLIDFMPQHHLQEFHL